MLLSTSDFVFLTASWGPTADPLIGERELRLMSEKAVLVNVADGRLINEEALLAALESESIAGAGLDVAAAGTPTAGHPLASAKNCVLTPYVAARTEEADDAVAQFVVENIVDTLNGKTPQGLVEVIDFPKAGDPAFWSSQMAPRD